MTRFSLSKIGLIVVAFCAATALPSSAQTFTSLTGFDFTNGEGPNWLVQGTNGNFYGTTQFGGLNSWGEVFEVTPAGVLTTVYNFVCTRNLCRNGALPNTGLLLGTDGNFYGLTENGGANRSNTGTVFEITPAGKLTTLHSFCALANCADGEYPSSLVQATNGNFYGTTSSGGTSTFGTVFELTRSGKLSTLYSFCPGGNGGDCPDGRNPTRLIQGSNGNFYGTTYEGGANGPAGGTIFEITPAGTLTTLHSFCSEADCADGASPDGLIQAANGNFYGVTYSGGALGCDGYGCGTFFEMTPTGTLTSLYSFCAGVGCAIGPGPVVQATDGRFYGTSTGGKYGVGTAFGFSPTGSLTTLYNFCSQINCDDGRVPVTGLMQSTNGTLYGTTAAGGPSPNCPLSDGCGTVFSISVGLGPFVNTVPTSGKVGANIIILGNNLTGTTSVSFNGKAATFIVVSDTEITAIVPSGATTGTVKVTTPSSTLSSNVRFQVAR
jgi:uncharacterized repeat protein (TIGR03803 family)